MRYPLTALCVLFAVSDGRAELRDSASITAEVLRQASPVYGWIAQQKLRGIYYSSLHEREYYQAAAAAGFNCVVNKTSGFRPDAPQSAMEFHVQQARLAAETGQKYIACINFNSADERKYTARRYTPMIGPQGTSYPDTPSPLDREFWNQAIKRRWLLLAEAAKTAPITGGMIDFEMYGSEILFYDLAGCLDYSDLALGGFAADQKLPTDPRALAPSQRAKWLKAQGLEEKYIAYYRRSIEAICRDIQREVHKVNPDFILGFYSWDRRSHFYEPCALGFGNARMPVLLWPGTTYTTGYSAPNVDDEVRRLAEIGAHAVFLPGIWLWQFHHDNLAAHAYDCAAHAGGYWLYGVYSMWAETARRRRVPNVDSSAYWTALRQANDEITAIEKDPRHRSSLRVAPDRTLFLAADPLLFAGKVMLRPWKAELPPAAPLDKQPPAALVRHVGVYRAYAEAGKTIVFRVHSVRLGKTTSGTVATVLGPDRQQVTEQKVPVGGTSDIAVHAAETGTYTLVCQSGLAGTMVQCDAPGLVIDAGESGAHFMSRLRPMYFFVPQGVKEFQVFGEGQGTERFNLKITAPDGQIALEQEDVGERRTFTVAVPAGQDGRPWLLNLARPTHGVLEDVKVGFSGNIPSYLAPAKERLLLRVHGQ